MPLPRFLFCVEAAAGTLLLLTEAAATQLAVIRLAEHSEVDIASGGIGGARGFEFADHGADALKALGRRGESCQAGGCSGQPCHSRKAVMLRSLTACIDEPSWAARFRIFVVQYR